MINSKVKDNSRRWIISGQAISNRIPISTKQANSPSDGTC